MDTKRIINRALIQKRVALAERLDSLCEKLGLSQQALAEKLGMDPAQLSRIMRGFETNPTLETIVRLEIALGEEILLTPEDHEEQLLENPTRLQFLLDASKTQKALDLKVEIATANPKPSRARKLRNVTSG